MRADARRAHPHVAVLTCQSTKRPPRTPFFLPPGFSVAPCRHASGRAKFHLQRFFTESLAGSEPLGDRHASGQGCPLLRRASGANSGHGPPFAALWPPLSRVGSSDLLPPPAVAFQAHLMEAPSAFPPSCFPLRVFRGDSPHGILLFGQGENFQKSSVAPHCKKRKRGYNSF